MAASLTVPPAVRLAFAKYAFQVCLRAEVDDLDFEGRQREICNHLELAWIQGVETKSDEAAEEDALQQYGSVEEASQLMKRPFWERFIFHHRYRTERLLLVLVCFFLQLVPNPKGKWAGCLIEVRENPDFGATLLVVLPLVFIYCWKRRSFPANLSQANPTAWKAEDMSLLAKIRSIVSDPTDELRQSTGAIWLKRFTGLIFFLAVLLITLPSTLGTATHYLYKWPVDGSNILIVLFYLWLQGVLLGIAATCVVHDAGLVRADVFRRWLLKTAH